MSKRPKMKTFCGHDSTDLGPLFAVEEKNVEPTITPYRTINGIDPYGRIVIKSVKVVKTKNQALNDLDLGLNQKWKNKVLDVIIELSKTLSEFTTDEVWAKLDALGIPRPPTNSQMGSCIRIAIGKNYIKKSGRFRPSLQKTNHQRDVAIWTSTYW